MEWNFQRKYLHSFDWPLDIYVELIQTKAAEDLPTQVREKSQIGGPHYLLESILVEKDFAWPKWGGKAEKSIPK